MSGECKGRGDEVCLKALKDGENPMKSYGTSTFDESLFRSRTVYSDVRDDLRQDRV